jgi:hypothetical protein
LPFWRRLVLLRRSLPLWGGLTFWCRLPLLLRRSLPLLWRRLSFWCGLPLWCCLSLRSSLAFWRRLALLLRSSLALLLLLTSLPLLLLNRLTLLLLTRLPLLLNRLVLLSCLTLLLLLNSLTLLSRLMLLLLLTRLTLLLLLNRLTLLLLTRLSLLLNRLVLLSCLTLLLLLNSLTLLSRLMLLLLLTRLTLLLLLTRLTLLLLLNSLTLLTRLTLLLLLPRLTLPRFSLVACLQCRRRTYIAVSRKGPADGRSGRSAMVYVGKLSSVGAGSALILHLCTHGSGMGLAVSCQFLGSGPYLQSARSAVETNARAAPAFLSIGAFVDVVHISDVHVVVGAVVVEMPAAPVAAFVANADVAKAVIDATVVADVRAPVTTVEPITVMPVAPVAGRPERPLIGSLHPSAGNPVVTGGSPCPVAGRP